jgi:hypothetical protein
MKRLDELLAAIKDLLDGFDAYPITLTTQAQARLDRLEDAYLDFLTHR